MYCVTIIGESSMYCDAIATGIYGLGLEEGINMINQINGYSAIFITTDKKVYLTKGLNFVPTDGTDDFTFIYS
jgi:thiamine biosynthesis lipoprotein